MSRCPVFSICQPASNNNCTVSSSVECSFKASCRPFSATFLASSIQHLKFYINTERISKTLYNMDHAPYLEYGGMDVQEILDLAEAEDEMPIVQVPNRYLRDAQNPMEEFNDREFRQRFRFGKEAVLHGLLPSVQEYLEKQNNRGLPISPLWQVLICLRFYATSSFQPVLHNFAGISQPTVSRVVRRVSLLFASLIVETIKMPEQAEARLENRRLFNNLGQGEGTIGLPGIDGAIGCTHVRLVGICGHILDETYRNRKGYFSLNVQAVVGPRTEFLDIVPEWPGSMPDSRIFRSSLLYVRYVDHRLDGMLVGDAGYPALPFLLTPIANPASDEHRVYNAIHARTRVVVERTFGAWKRRFPCLQHGLGTKLETATTIVVACAVLHNLALRYNDVLQEEDVEQQDEDEGIHRILEDPRQWEGRQASGFVVRERVIQRLFS